MHAQNLQNNDFKRITPSTFLAISTYLIPFVSQIYFHSGILFRFDFCFDFNVQQKGIEPWNRLQTNNNIPIWTKRRRRALGPTINETISPLDFRHAFEAACLPFLTIYLDSEKFPERYGAIAFRASEHERANVYLCDSFTNTVSNSAMKMIVGDLWSFSRTFAFI